eukprot:6201871-Pleurochrysis_carterae.AAC.1
MRWGSLRSGPGPLRRPRSGAQLGATSTTSQHALQRGARAPMTYPSSTSPCLLPSVSVRSRSSCADPGDGGWGSKP